MQASKLGRRAAIIEKRQSLGGVAINPGTVPSQTLREAQQAATMLGVSLSTVKELLRRGEIRPQQWGAKPLISHEELVRVSKRHFIQLWPERHEPAAD